MDFVFVRNRFNEIDIQPEYNTEQIKASYSYEALFYMYVTACRVILIINPQSRADTGAISTHWEEHICPMQTGQFEEPRNKPSFHFPSLMSREYHRRSL